MSRRAVALGLLFAFRRTPLCMALHAIVQCAFTLEKVPLVTVICAFIAYPARLPTHGAKLTTPLGMDK
jgi:hypothetical protein